MIPGYRNKDLTASKRGNNSGLALLSPEGARSATGGEKPQPFAEEDGVASTAFEVTVKVLMRANGLQINQPHPIIETVPKQI